MNVFIIMTAPVFIAIFVFVVNFGLFVDKRIRLQVAVDRGVFAGAARLSHIMNEISDENRAIFESFKKVDKNADISSWQSGECQNRVNELKQTQAAALQRIDELIAGGYEDAHMLARKVALANYEDATYQPLYGTAGEPLFHLVTGGEPTPDGKSQIDEDDTDELIRKNIICGNISGMVFDPTDVAAKDNPNIIRYVYQDGTYVGLVAGLSATFTPPLVSSIFGPMNINAIAAAKPYGGTIKKFDHFKPVMVREVPDEQ